MNEKCKRTQIVPQLKPRSANAHKGDFGRVLVIGGSRGMIGAPALAGLSALRSGAGLVTIAVPESIQPSVITLCPCATSIPLPETDTGQIDPAASRRLFKNLGLLEAEGPGVPPDVIIAGPGVGMGPAEYGAQFWELINAFRNGPLIPAVIDADALNLIRRSSSDTNPGWNNQYHFRTVITPHPGELAGMQGVTTREIQDDREGYAIRTARAMSAENDQEDYTTVVVLKGDKTVVTDGDTIYINRTGNSGMATGGSGDVLSGTITALIGQGMNTMEAAILGVNLHGLAGDIAAKKTGLVSLIATDIIDALPQAFIKKGTGPGRKRRAPKK
ncbi:MAG: NAD(P)H-hydrate dehydratase [Planctomycetota bacterium]